MRGLYIHIPFCKSKCKYCAFYSVTNFTIDSIKDYLKAIINELSLYSDYKFHTLFIGGGTPSVIPPHILEKFLEDIFKNLATSLTEFSFEANPESLTEEKIKILKDFGCNRISLGIQSFDNRTLQFLGRIHRNKDSYTAIHFLKKHEIPFNIDLIFDIPTIDKKIIVNSLLKAIDLKPAHISAYNYSFDTDFLLPYKRQAKESGSIIEIHEILTGAGYDHYEISNFAKPGYQCLHNINYWKMGDFIGLGASAHSMLNFDNKRIRFSKPNSFSRYTSYPHFLNSYEIIRNTKEILKENILFGLRLLNGIPEKLFRQVELTNKLRYLINENLLKKQEGNICITLKGLNYFDYIQDFLY